MRRLALALALATLVGCASLPGGSRSARSTRTASSGDDAAQRARVLELQKQAAMAEAEIRLLRRQLADLTVEVERLAAAAPATARSVPETGPRASEGTPPIRPAAPEIAETDLEPVRVDLPEPIEAPAPQVVTVPVPSERPGREPAPAATEPVSLAGQSIYDRGYTLYHQGSYLDAEASFQKFLQGHENTDLADNAQFWIGESRFARGDYPGARLAFQEVLDRYPSGNKGADALLKVGDCLRRMGDEEAARSRFEEVRSRFPGSVAAVMAEERLASPDG